MSQVAKVKILGNAIKKKMTEQNMISHIVKTDVN